MSYYTTCPDCGAALDPCERCECLLLSACNVRRAEYDVLDDTLGPLPCYELTETSAEEWARQAMATNQKSFEHFHGRPAASEDEVLEFTYRMAYDENWAYELARHYEAVGKSCPPSVLEAMLYNIQGA